MNKITSSKLDAQKLARLIEGTTTKCASKQKAHSEVVSSITSLVNDPAKIVSPNYTAEVKSVKEYLANQAAKINY